MEPFRPYTKLVAWQRADEYVRIVYRLTESLPSNEKFGLISQWRRAAVSVVLNIVEGQARGSTKDAVRFLYIARGSLSESTYLGDLSMNLGYVKKGDHEAMEKVRNSLSYLLQQLITSLNLP